MKRRVWKFVGLTAVGGLLLQAGACSYMAEFLWYNIVPALINQALLGTSP